ncbi:hypothetical protein [Streptomyces scopuliridis]|uniref:hypothetical protein n=1 Tax=Streptomyces scopuliridis TaxID=452529 RepID=UPI0010580290|nr:hypothetical protein [Streptomyces scopuliridis]
MNSRALGLVYPLLLLGAVLVLVVLLAAEGRRDRRARARRAEQLARPPAVSFAALLDELAIHREAVRHACCAGWWTPGHLYRHHPDCTKEQHHA